MTPSRRRLALAGFLVLGLGACRNAPILSQTGAEFLGRGNLATRGEQIRAAGAGLGWAMESRGPGLTRGILNLRGHQAVVDIPYDQQRFTIRYASSTNLDYDGQTIHRNYNSWVQNLQNAIVAQSANASR